MDDGNISRLESEMNQTTRAFLSEFTPKLNDLFHEEISSVYLNRMNDHLQTFYKDVLDELETKESTMSKKITELLKEAADMKSKLSLDFEMDLRRPEKMPMMIYQEKLDLDLTEMRETFQQRMSQINDCLRTQQLLCDELNEEPRDLATDPLASESEIYNFEKYLLDLKTEKARRMNEIENIRFEIQSLQNEMGVDADNEDEEIPAPTTENIQKLQSELVRYQKEKENLKNECEQILEKLEVLWDCLEAPSSIRDKIRDIAREYKTQSLGELQRELKMCKINRQENIKHFIKKIRDKLVEQWDKIYKSQEERDQFEFIRSETYTEDLLTLHEMELDECIRFYNENKNIYELFQSRNQWWEKKKALEAKQNEPNRYNNRGGQLLKEEKERKQTDIEIPKIEKKIKALAEEYSRQYDRKFLINGTCIIELIDNDWESYRGTKELLKSARKVGVTPAKVGQTPRTPMHGQLTLKRMASTTNLGMTTGNLAKKRHLDIPGKDKTTYSSSVQKINVTSTRPIRSTKRNLLNQYEEGNVSFMRPVRPMQQRLAIPAKKNATLANISANKIRKKYRLSSNRRSSHLAIVSDESLVNYDAFETNMKISQMSNSSVIGLRDNTDRENGILKDKTVSKLRVQQSNFRAKSPLKPSNFRTLRTNNVVDLV